MSDAIEGEVVDPGKVYVCETGRAQATRRQLDRDGQYGGTIRESAQCPKGQIFALDLDWLDAYRAELLDQWQAEFRTPPQPPHDLAWMYRTPMNITPPTFPPITGV